MSSSRTSSVFYATDDDTCITRQPPGTRPRSLLTYCVILPQIGRCIRSRLKTQFRHNPGGSGAGGLAARLHPSANYIPSQLLSLDRRGADGYRRGGGRDDAGVPSVPGGAIGRVLCCRFDGVSRQISQLRARHRAQNRASGRSKGRSTYLLHRPDDTYHSSGQVRGR